MTIDEFVPKDMQILSHAIERVCPSMSLTRSVEHRAMKSRVTQLVVECAEDGERDVQALVDCAQKGLAKGNGR